MTQMSSSQPAVVLAVTRNEQHRQQLQALFAGSSWKLETVSSIEAATALLPSRCYPAVISDRELPDGCWYDLVSATEGLPFAPRVLVLADEVDHRLWAEVLNLGGYDVLACPPRARDVFPDLITAWQSQRSGQDSRHSVASA